MTSSMPWDVAAAGLSGRRTRSVATLRRMASMGALLLCGAAVLPAHAETAQTEAPSAQAESETARLNQWFDAKFEEQMAFSPMWYSYRGEKTAYDKIDDLSEAGMLAPVEWRRKSVEEMKAKFDRARLTKDAQVSYDLWINQYEHAALAYKFRRNEYVFNQMNSPHAWLPQFLIAIHRVDELSDMDAYVARIGGISRGLKQSLERAKLNAAAGSRPPRFSYDLVLDQCRDLISGAPFGGEGSSALLTDAQAKIDALVKNGKLDRKGAERYSAAVREALIKELAPSYREIIAWLEADRSNADTIATGVGKNPGGKEYYEAQLVISTTTDLNADQIHEIGISEVARIKNEMEAIKEQVGFKGSLQEFFAFVRDDDQFYYPNTDEGRQAYIDAATKHLSYMTAKLPQYFGILPKAEVVVKRVEPFRETAGAAQHYQLASPDGSRPGVYYAHLIDMKAMPIPQLEVIAYHEGNPGHHMQFSIAQELTNVPKFRTMLYYNALQEGWGLYSEYLAKEMGGYKDPYSDFGRLTTEIWRAIRLVVDTGLHSKGWTEQQAVAYFSENSPAAEGQIRSEVQRYIVMPGQATGYKIGMIKMLELRRKAEAALGKKFDIKGFHDTVLGAGQMPLDILERRIDDWIAAQQSR
jgi:uncharacterized protein (DUF885 family)